MDAAYLQARLSEEEARAARAVDPRAKTAHLGMVRAYRALLDAQTATGRRGAVAAARTDITALL